MKTTILLTLLLALSAGCSTIVGTRKAPDGSVLTLTSHRFLWTSEGVNFSLADTNGLTVGLAVQHSSPDAQSIQALTTGVNTMIGTAMGAAAKAAVKP